MKKFLKIFTSSLLLISMLAPALPVFATDIDQMQPLENLKGLGGNWNFGDPITCSGSGENPSGTEAPSALLPLLIGVGVAGAIGTIVAVVIMKKKK